MMLRSGTCVLIFTCIIVTTAEGPQCPPSVNSERCREDGSAVDEYFFFVNGEKMTIIYNMNYLKIECMKNLTLESAEMPRLRKLVEVRRVQLSGCELPPGGYVRALRGLGVAARDVLQLVRQPARPALAAGHLRGLAVAVLVLVAAAPLRLDPGALEPLAQLRDLRLTNVTLSPADALRLPPALRSLQLHAAGLERLPAAVFARLPELVTLRLRDTELRELDVSLAPALGTMSAAAPLEGVTLAPRLVNLTLESARSVALRGAGAALRSLTALRCNLTELPPRWLEAAPNLRELDLSYNNLKNLTSELVVSLPRLETLQLTGNKLGSDAVTLAAALPRLRDLVFDRNPLGDLCGGAGDLRTDSMSPLWGARGLRRLGLVRTGAARVCRDWREQLRALAALDLRGNRVARLDRAALAWRRDVPTRVDLRGNPVRAVRYSRADYLAALAAPPAPDVTLLLNSKLDCDCGEYWYARALRDAPRHAAALRPASCGARELLAVPPHELLCELAGEPCARGCRCRVNDEQSELSCEGAGLRAAPRAPAPPRALLLARNNLTRLAPADVPPGLRLLDLRDNQIADIDLPTARALAAPALELHLDGNPLRCSCAALPALRLLAARGGAGGRCAGPAEPGAPLADAVARLDAGCGGALWPLALAGVALCVASAVVAVCLARPAVRHRIKGFLVARGLCVRSATAADEDADRDYDVFVSYSHHDAALAAQLAARLEAGARRLLLHERDWAPGELIPTQIAASVRRARRTLALLSPHYAASRWARAELREACVAALREARPRLLVVLLPGAAPAAAAAAEPALRTYLAAVTYLQWEDPRFWEKLDAALPPPRAPSAVAAPSAGAARAQGGPLPAPPLTAPRPREAEKPTSNNTIEVK